MPEESNRTKKRDEDTRLIEAINSGRSGQSGQQQLFYDLVKRYERRLYNFGFKICGDVRDAEDLVQETFLNVFKYLGSFRYETKFKNWLYRIASNICIKKRRKSKFAPERELSLDDFLPSEGAEPPTELPEWANAPLEKLLNDELSETLKKAVLSLPETYRVVIMLRDFEEFSTEETAQILNVTPSNVKVRLHRARLFLREKLKEYYDQNRDPAPP
ncbi:MAG: RNA polymerase sigma factor [Desulfobacteraceae bacterium]|nr:MAG: RNA polymerase sigma factor [Desulfobacteraceae bacterium]